MAKRWNVSREEQDKFACHSQQKCEEAQKQGYFTKEIIPISISGRGGNSFYLFSHLCIPWTEGAVNSFLWTIGVIVKKKMDNRVNI